MKKLVLIMFLIYITFTSFSVGFAHGKDVPIIYSIPYEIQY